MDEHQNPAAPAGAEVSDDEDGLVSFQLLGQGTWDAATRCTTYNAIEITAEGKTETFKVGDFVHVLSANENEQNWPCRLEKLWESEDKKDLRFDARWLYSSKEIKSHPHKFVGPITRNGLADRMAEHEVVLGTEVDSNDCSSILSKLTVNFTETVPPREPANNQNDEVHVFFCRYILVTELPDPASGRSSAMISVARFNDINRKKNHQNAVACVDETVRAIEADASLSSDSSDDDEDDPLVGQQTATVEGEGSMLRGDIQVGKRHQADVPPFKSGLKPRNRNPILVWRKDAISDTELHSFLENVAVLHNAYLDKNGLSQEEPYSPLPTGPTEHWMRLHNDQPLTGSFMSTASMLASSGVDAKGLPKLKSPLRKECDPDVIMETLNKHNYDTQAALNEIKQRLNDISAGVWTYSERELYDDGFRHHQTDLRSIAKTISTRSVKETIDFHFRFKIPDQFRVFQNRKREQAVRMVECMEKRRYHDAIQGHPPPDSNKRRKGKSQSSHWTETASSDVPQALEARRRQAREFLLDVNDMIGHQTMVEIAGLLKELHNSRSSKRRKDLFALLEGNQDLHDRLLNFFPDS